MVIMQTTRFRFKLVFFPLINFQTKKSIRKIIAIGIGRRHEKKDFTMYIDYPNTFKFRSCKKQSKEMTVSEVCPTTAAEENAFLNIFGN